MLFGVRRAIGLGLFCCTVILRGAPIDGIRQVGGKMADSYVAFCEGYNIAAHPEAMRLVYLDRVLRPGRR